MLVNNFTTKFFGALFVLQGTSGLPTSLSPKSLVKRDPSTRAWFKIFGDTQRPELQDLADATFLLNGLENSKQIIVNRWISILAGFTNSNETWPLSFFPAQVDHPVVFPSGQAYSLPYSSFDTMRHAVYAHLASMEKSQKLVPGFDFNTLADKPWWPWALLEGVQTYALNDTQVEIARTITTLSGVEAVVIDQQELETMAEKNLLVNIYSNATFSPVWVQYDSDDEEYMVIRGLDEVTEKINLISLQPSYTEHGLIGKDGRDLVQIPHRVVHLKDMVRFEGRVGVWDMPAEPLQSQG